MKKKKKPIRRKILKSNKKTDKANQKYKDLDRMDCIKLIRWVLASFKLDTEDRLRYEYLVALLHDFKLDYKGVYFVNDNCYSVKIENYEDGELHSYLFVVQFPKNGTVTVTLFESDENQVRQTPWPGMIPSTVSDAEVNKMIDQIKENLEYGEKHTEEASYRYALAKDLIGIAKFTEGRKAFGNGRFYYISVKTPEFDFTLSFNRDVGNIWLEDKVISQLCYLKFPLKLDLPDPI